MPVRKKIMFINRRGPYGSCYAQEALEITLVGAAFDQRISLALVDDGVFLLRTGQDTSGVRLKPFTAAYRALGDFEVEQIYVERESLDARGMVSGDLMPVMSEAGGQPRSLVRILSSAELAEVIADQDILMNH
jgi:tRNA 2-thiouridine synthesizing protein C